MEATPANVHDTRVASKLIRDDDEVVYGDSGYPGIEKREETVSDEHLFGKPRSKPRRGVVRGL